VGKLIKKYKDNYTHLPNSIFKDKRLSYKELGLLNQMLSLPDYWEFSSRGLASLHSDSRATIQRTLNKLIEYGYVWRDTKDKMMSRTSDGRFDKADYYIYDDPSENPHYNAVKDQILAKNLAQNQATDEENLAQNPSTVNPSTVNEPKLNNKESNISTNKGIYNNNKNTKFSKATAIVDGHGNSVVEKKDKPISKGFDVNRFINSPGVVVQISRISEAMYFSEESRKQVSKAIKYFAESCNCFGIEKIKIINQFTDEEYSDLFNIAYELANADDSGSSYDGIVNPKGFLSEEIKKRIANHSVIN